MLRRAGMWQDRLATQVGACRSQKETEPSRNAATAQWRQTRSSTTYYACAEAPLEHTTEINMRKCLSVPGDGNHHEEGVDQSIQGGLLPERMHRSVRLSRKLVSMELARRTWDEPTATVLCPSPS
jgi:hypothetical protein